MNGSSRASRIALLALALLLSGAAAGPAAAAPAPATAARLITLDAEDAPLASVLKILAEKGDLNIITGTGANTASRLTIHMKDVPLDQAVNLVVRAAGLAYERIGNSILVAESRALKEETGLSSYVVDLHVRERRGRQGGAAQHRREHPGGQGRQPAGRGHQPARHLADRGDRAGHGRAGPAGGPRGARARDLHRRRDEAGHQLGRPEQPGRGHRRGRLRAPPPRAPCPTRCRSSAPSGGYKNMWSLRGMSRQAFAWRTAVDLMIHDRQRAACSPTPRSPRSTGARPRS